MKNSSCIVALLPDNAQAEVPVGTLLSDAIRQAGLEAYVPCGGQGRCGRCLVRIEKGTVQRRPNSRLTAKQIAQGWALSCQTEVTGNVSAFLPPDKTRVEEEVAGTAALKAPREAPPPRDPVVSHHLIELNPPTLQDNAADLERLRRTLAGAPGIRNLDAGVAVARDLHRTLKEGEWKATAVVEHALRGGRMAPGAKTSGISPSVQCRTTWSDQLQRRMTAAGVSADLPASISARLHSGAVVTPM